MTSPQFLASSSADSRAASGALPSAIGGFAIDGSGRTTCPFAAGFASSPFVSMIEQAVLAMFPAGAAPGQLDMVTAVFVIPTLAYCAIAATLSMASTPPT
jgi:hypothetical protein